MADNEILRRSGDGDAANEVAFDYVKATNFRVIWADGAFGGLTPQGHVHFALYSERPAIPQRQVHKINPQTGTLGPPIPEKTIGRTAYVREMSCDVMMTPDAARSLAQWLTQQADAMQRRTNQ